MVDQLRELKAEAYDLMVQVEQAQQALTAKNREIAQAMQDASASNGQGEVVEPLPA